MSLRHSARHTIAAVFLGSSLLLPAAAPGQPAPVPAPLKPVKVPCCKCIGGPAQTVSINTGSAPWFVTPPSGPTTLAVQVPTPPTSWTTALLPARWVHHPTAGQATGWYVYQLRIDVPKCVIPMTVRISGRLASDNQGQLTLGSSSPPLNIPSPSFTSPTPVWSSTLGPGTHILTVRVRNNELQTGLVLNGTVVTRCSTALEQGGGTAVSEPNDHS